MKAYVGVSGFSYVTWKGNFYPKDTKSEDLLSLYSSRLGTVEINSSFYAAPGRATIENWADKTGESFKFSFKSPRLVTHVMKLNKGAAEAANNFSKTLDHLGARRGPVLFQLPPYSKQNLELLDDFLTETSGIQERVFEFRHESWLNNSTYELLEKRGCGFCIAETEDLRPIPKVTGEFAYFRLRKDSYDAEVVDRWAGKIRDIAESSENCYVYFRHDDTGANAILAERLSGKLGGE